MSPAEGGEAAEEEYPPRGRGADIVFATVFNMVMVVMPSTMMLMIQIWSG